MLRCIDNSETLHSLYSFINKLTERWRLWLISCIFFTDQVKWLGKPLQCRWLFRNCFSQPEQTVSSRSTTNVEFVTSLINILWSSLLLCSDVKWCNAVTCEQVLWHVFTCHHFPLQCDIVQGRDAVNGWIKYGMKWNIIIFFYHHMCCQEDGNRKLQSPS